MKRIIAPDGTLNLQLEFEPVSLTSVLHSISVRCEPLRPADVGEFTTIVALCDLGPSTLSFVERGSGEYLRQVESAPGGTVLVERSWGEAHRHILASAPAAVFLVDRPRLTVARIIDHLQIEDEISYYGVHPTAVVDPEANLHPTVTIGPFCVIGRCEIGEGSRISPFTSVQNNVIIGKRVRVRDHCNLGGHSLGFARDEKSSWVRIGHTGWTLIEDGVELFPYANVDRGTFGATRVRRGAVIGYYVLVGHNSDVGEDAMVTADVVLCGQSRVGARTWLGVGSIIKQGVHVGSDCMVGLGAVVLQNVPDGSVVAGVPAKAIRGAEK